MQFKSFSAAILAIGTMAANSAFAGILPNFVGNWAGTCAYDVVGQPTEIIPTTLTIQDVDANTASWNITYNRSTGPITKSYLIRAGATPSRFVMDEQNGILIDEFLVGNRLMADYDYNAATRIRSTMEVNGNALYFENTAFDVANARSTRAGSARVKSYVWRSLEACDFTK